MFENEPCAGFPPEKPLPIEEVLAWQELHAAIARRAVMIEQNQRVRAAIGASTCYALYLALTQNDRRRTLRLHGGLFVGVEGERGLRDVSVDPETIAAALNDLRDDNRRTIAAIVAWRHLEAEYEDRFRTDDERASVSRTTLITPRDPEDEDDDVCDEDDGEIDEENEEDAESWGERDDFSWKDGMGSDDRSWRETPIEEDDDVSEDELDPYLLRAIVHSSPEIEEYHRAIVEGRIQPEDLLRKIAG